MYIKNKNPLFPKGFCTRSGNRTRTRFRANRILSPACLPVPPSEQMVISIFPTIRSPERVGALIYGESRSKSGRVYQPAYRRQVPPSEQMVISLPVIKSPSPYGEGFRVRLSERRDSNSRPRPWQGRALPTELLSHFGECKYR